MYSTVMSDPLFHCRVIRYSIIVAPEIIYYPVEDVTLQVTALGASLKATGSAVVYTWLLTLLSHYPSFGLGRSAISFGSRLPCCRC